MEYQKTYFENEKVTVHYSNLGEENNEFHLMLIPNPEVGNFEEQLKNIQKALKKTIENQQFNNAKVIFKRYFMSDSANQFEQFNALEKPNGKYAVSSIQQPPLNGSKVAVWVYLAENMHIAGKEHGIVATHNNYLHIWDAQRHGEGHSSSEQTNQIFHAMEKNLLSEGCNLKDNCIRTWLFVHNVDVNYCGVVEARKSFFEERDMIPKTHYISSTGIEGRNKNPLAIVTADAYSVGGIHPSQITFLKASSHLNPTYEYGVTFERGTAIDYGDRRHIFISGTASINNKGDIVHLNDVLKQAERAMQNVNALLAEANATTTDIAQMIVYLRDTADYKSIQHFFEQNYAKIPFIVVLAPVCRPGWLIEIECIAICKQCVPDLQKF